MISDEKINHICLLMLNDLEKTGAVSYVNKEAALTEGRRICLGFLTQMTDVEKSAKRRISTQKNPPPEGSPQWQVLYEKYLEEEMRKKGS